MNNRYRATLYCAIALLSYTQALSQDHTLDASTLSEERTLRSDFNKGFTIIFTNNTNRNAKLHLVHRDGAVTPLKDGFRTEEQSQFALVFSIERKELKVTGSGGQKIKIESPFQLDYAGKVITIEHAESAPAPKDSGPGVSGPRISGVEIHDAILATRFYEGKNDSLLIILALYKNLANATAEELNKAYENNPYIKKLLTDFKAAPSKTVSTGGEGLKGLITKAGNVDVTNIADGIARFLVKRTKEELNITFFQHFKDVLNEDKMRDARLLFPRTVETFNAIDEDIYQFDNYITTLRENFESDLSLLLDHFPEVIEDGTFREYFNQHPSLKYSLLLGLNSSRELVNGTHPGKIIESLNPLYVKDIGETNATASIQTIQLISSSLRSMGSEKYWTSSDTVRMLLSKDNVLSVTARFYLGFLFERGSGIQFKSKALQHYFGEAEKNIEKVNQYLLFINKLGQELHNIESAISQIKDKSPDKPSIDHYHRLLDSFSNIADHIVKLGELPYIQVDGKISNEVSNYIRIFRQTNDLALNISQRNYNSAVLNAYNIYLVSTELKKSAGDEKINNNTLLFTDKTDAKVVANEKIEVAAARPGQAETTNDNSREEKEKGKLTKRINDIAIKNADVIKRYGTFMANVVKAKSSDEVAAAIEAVALPVGSATIKKHSQVNISLNAYVGPYIGSEKIEGLDNNFSTNAYGLTAPIGIAISKGWNVNSKNGWSTSIFLSVIDLGAPVAFRFKDDETEEIPSVKLKDIVSPGIFLSIGLPRMPLSLNYGWQMGPLLRQVNVPLEEESYSRLSFSITVDIPIINFYKSGN